MCQIQRTKLKGKMFVLYVLERLAQFNTLDTFIVLYQTKHHTWRWLPSVCLPAHSDMVEWLKPLSDFQEIQYQISTQITVHIAWLSPHWLWWEWRCCYGLKKLLSVILCVLWLWGWIRYQNHHATPLIKRECWKSLKWRRWSAQVP